MSKKVPDESRRIRGNSAAGDECVLRITCKNLSRESIALGGFSSSSEYFSTVKRNYRTHLEIASFQLEDRRRKMRFFTPTLWFTAIMGSISKPNISHPPGSLMQSLAEFLCSRKSYEQVAKPIIADLQVEYFEALTQRRKFKALYIRCRYFCSFCIALGLISLIKKFVEAWRKVSF